MRKTILLCIWLLVPVVLLAYHYGPGQSRLAMDRAAQKIAEAKAFEAKGDWAAAYAAWSEALAATPAEKATARFQMRLAQARTRMWTGDLPEAITDLENLLAEAQRGGADKEFQSELRSTLAGDRKSTRLNSSHLVISYAVFCLKKKKKNMVFRVIGVLIRF